MTVLSERVVGAADMADVGALVLGEQLAVGGAGSLHAVLTDASGTQAELLSLRLPELQPLYAVRFGVPSAVSAAYLDAASGWLYVLCAAVQPKLLRMRVVDGEPAAPAHRGDALALPWPAASSLLLPFGEQRQLLVFAARARAVEGRPLRVCRIRLGTPLTEVCWRPLETASCGLSRMAAPCRPSRHTSRDSLVGVPAAAPHSPRRCPP
eukprot:2076293-Prymnesium_polylepis.1